MRLSKAQLKQIINEELQKLSFHSLNEADNEFKSTAAKLERYVPLIKKVCSLLPIETFTSVRFVDEDDIQYKSYEDAKNRAFYHVNAYIVVSVGNSPTDDESYDLMKFGITDWELWGRLNLEPYNQHSFDNEGDVAIDLAWLKEQSDFLAFEDMDVALQDAVREFILGGRVDIKPGIVVDVDLD